MAAADRPPRARLLLLGASNVRRMLPELVREARWRLGAPLDVVASHGSGRSYLGPSSLLFRGLDRIAPDAFWSFEQSQDAPACALVADPGNDLAYGARPEVVAASIERLVARLVRGSRCVVIAGPPLASLASLGPLRFQAARALLFPTRRIDRARVKADAEELDARLRAIAQAYHSTHVAPRAEWYGIDPIHVRLRARGEAARTLLEALGPRRGAEPGSLELGALSRLKPQSFSWFGIQASWPQPSARLADGTRVSWF
ncbi:MAG: hypothetical protein JNK02_07450 [Planctomycetes bacterium]|nr:hypothetical protein [Planctomycetota bacterium]